MILVVDRLLMVMKRSEEVDEVDEARMRRGEREREIDSDLLALIPI